MGTRNLTMVIMDGETRVAQYGQWDGYPEGQGATVLEFCKDKSKLAALRVVLARTVFSDDDISSPYSNRDHGADVLNMMVDSEPGSEIILRNDSDFARDSLFCEWAYVIDLDEEQLECYVGFVTKPHEGQRFSGDTTGKYYPIRLLKKYPLSSLPSEGVFAAELNDLNVATLSESAS